MGRYKCARLLRSDLNGENKETLFQDNLGGGVTGIELDVESNLIYFCTSDNLYVSNLDVFNPTVFGPPVERVRGIAWIRTMI